MRIALLSKASRPALVMTLDKVMLDLQVAPAAASSLQASVRGTLPAAILITRTRLLR